MKKISYLLIAILSVYIFYSGFSSFSSDQINRMNSFATSIGQTTNKKVIGLNLQFNEDLVSTIHEYCEETNSTGIIEVYENTEGFITKNLIYIYSADPQDLKSLYIRNDQKRINFKKDSKNYYSTNLNDKDAYNYIDYLNRGYYGDYNDIYEFHTLNDLLNHTPGSEIITLYSISNSNKTSTSQMKDYFKEFIPENSQGQGISDVEIVPYSMQKEKFLNMVFLNAILGTALIFAFIFLKDRKEIVIRKMLGNSNKKIFISLYTKHIAILYGLFLFLEIILFALFVGPYRPCASLFLYYLINEGIKLLFSLIMIGIILLISTITVKSVKYIKQNGTQENKTVLSLVLKGILIFVLFPVFLTNCADWIESVHYLYILNLNESQMSNKIITNGISVSLNEDLFYSSELVNKLYYYMQEHNGIYEDFDINKRIDFLKNHMDSDLEIPVSNEIPYIVVNNNYLKDYTIRDEFGNPLDFNQIEESILLIPENYSFNQDQISYYSNYEDCKVIRIKPNFRFVRHMPYVENTKDLEKINPVIFIDHNWMENARVSTDNYFIPIDTKKSVSNFKRFLIQNNMDKKVKFYLSDSYFAQVKNKKTYELISLTILIVLISTILFVYQLQAIVIFLFEKRYYLSIQYLLGKSFYERYSLYLSINISLYLSVIIFYALYSKRILESFEIGFLILGIDLIFTIFTLKKKEYAECVDSLKGAR